MLAHWYSLLLPAQAPPDVIPATSGGAKAKKSPRPAWVVPAQFIKPLPIGPVEESEALMLCGAL
jgi:hypothetical protein